MNTNKFINAWECMMLSNLVCKRRDRRNNTQSNFKYEIQRIIF